MTSNTRIAPRILGLVAGVLLTTTVVPAQEASTMAAAPLRVLTASNSIDTMNCNFPVQGTHCIRLRCGNNCVQSIPDLGTRTVNFGITAESLASLGVENCSIRDLNFAVDLVHTDVGDLEISLAKGAQVVRTMYEPSQACNATSFDGVFDDESGVPEDTCPFTGSTLRSHSSLTGFNTLDPVGSWSLSIEDKQAADSGTLRDYGLALDMDCSATGGGGNCVETPTALCLNNNRFRVSAQFQVPGGSLTQAQVVPLTSDTGYTWHLNSANVESVIKVLNGCGVNGRYWVFAGGLTNVRVVITVTDTQTGATKTYTNPQGAPFQPIQDTNAFATCP